MSVLGHEETHRLNLLDGLRGWPLNLWPGQMLLNQPSQPGVDACRLEILACGKPDKTQDKVLTC